MTAEFCELYQMEKTGCIHCKTGSVREPKEKIVFSYNVVLAKYDGRCILCKTEYNIGTPIRKNVNGDGWIGECCFEEEDPLFGFYGV